MQQDELPPIASSLEDGARMLDLSTEAFKVLIDWMGRAMQVSRSRDHVIAVEVPQMEKSIEEELLQKGYIFRGPFGHGINNDKIKEVVAKNFGLFSAPASGPWN